MAVKGLHLFDECAAKSVHFSSQEKGCTSSSWGDGKMYISGTIANSQRTPTEINKKVLLPKQEF